MALPATSSADLRVAARSESSLSIDTSAVVIGTVVLVIVRIGTLIPNAPANLGSYQFFCVFAMRLLGVENNNAKIFSTIMFWGLTIPPLIGGAVAVALTGLNLGEIRHHAHHAHKRRFEAIETPAPEN